MIGFVNREAREQYHVPKDVTIMTVTRNSLIGLSAALNPATAGNLANHQTVDKQDQKRDKLNQLIDNISRVQKCD